MQVSTMIAVVAVSAVCLTAAKLWFDLCKHKRRDWLLKRMEELKHEICKAVDDEPENLALHLRLRGEFVRVCRELKQLG